MRTFKATEFLASKSATAEEKAKFANHFVRFVSDGFQRFLFTKPFYQRLSNTFGHIAHYNQNGFYGAFFTTPQDQCRFVRVCVQHGGQVGDPLWTFSDVENALAAWLVESGVALNLANLTQSNTAVRELSLRDQLLVKYPLDRFPVPAGVKHKNRKNTFDGWMEKARNIVEREIGLSTDGLPDQPYHDWYDGGVSPSEAARSALADM